MSGVTQECLKTSDSCGSDSVSSTKTASPSAEMSPDADLEKCPEALKNVAGVPVEGFDPVIMDAGNSRNEKNNLDFFLAEPGSTSERCLPSIKDGQQQSVEPPKLDIVSDVRKISKRLAIPYSHIDEWLKTLKAHHPSLPLSHVTLLGKHENFDIETLQ
ncbi:hypothetical protein QAD02_013649 [Eretmocerus hayati]|uniref:Uncharacterized protein n=1 Tax=Eretmocerus hayati TaxID=131215 RepID=A0ACC2P5Z7_9HYME|nr:hypothetical protein QAD02_013649 [Eretmocerus hayati]